MGMAMVGLVGAIIGSFSMMLFASSHFATVAGQPGNVSSVVNAAPLTGGGSDQDRIISAVKRVTPSVVAINVTINGRQYVPPNPLAPFFGGQSGGGYRPFREQASGSGFIYNRSGLIITNAHVVGGMRGTTSSKIEVVFANNKRATAKVYALNPAVDVALIKVDDATNLPPPVEFSDSDKLQAGQWAIAIGEPLELKQSVTLGVVSGFNRSETVQDESGRARQFKGLLQTSAPINPGNSGGPLVDLDGRLIGVNQITASPQYGAQGIGFAIPANLVRTEVANLEKNPGKTITAGSGQGFVGVSLSDVTTDIRSQLNYKGEGAAIQAVYPNTPADQAGLQPGDVIQKVNGKDVRTAADFRGTVEKLKPGSPVSMQIWSSGIRKLVTVNVGDKGQYEEQMQQQQGQQQIPLPGQQTP
ncbi:MAG: hypothetical protein NVSMB60_34040 [Mycobacterium sp.]